MNGCRKQGKNGDIKEGMKKDRSCGGLGVRGPAARGRCGRRAGCLDPLEGASPQPYLPADTREAERGGTDAPRTQDASAGASRGHPRRRQVRPSHLWPQLLPHDHASRRGGTGPASVEPSLRPVFGAPPQVSTPRVLGAVYWARHEPPSIPLSVPGTPPPPPWAAFLLGSSRFRTSAPSPPAPA